MITPHTYNTLASEKSSWLVFSFLVAAFLLVAGKEIIVWLLMKLYEFFIQKNPLQ
ncbi:MAG TPA: hypothetical protein VI461_09295 [Chitinophagaceae bacterium]|nr:hypothetical protein [Chitinophagaceae bacterium]